MDWLCICTGGAMDESKMTTVTITEAIGDPVGCYYVSEATLIWVQIECDSSYLYELAPVCLNWLAYFS